VNDVRTLLRIGLFVAVTAGLSFIRVPLPFSPVPVTGQTLGTMLAGLLLGARAGAVSQLIYVLLGFTGLPLFGGLGGAAILLGPAGGYLIGMILGAWVTGIISRGREGVPIMFISCLIGGALIVYIPGVWQLARVTGMDIRGAAAIGVLPYIPGDIVKSVAAVGAAAKIRTHLDLRDRG